MNGSRSQGLNKFQRPGLKRLNLYLCLNLVWIPSFLSYSQACLDMGVSRMRVYLYIYIKYIVSQPSKFVGFFSIF